MNPFDELQPVRCAIHVHTALDDGALPMERVIEEAEACGVDALLTTGHNHMLDMEASRWEGTHGNVCVVIGTELSTRRNDHLLSFGLHDRIATRILDAPAALDLLYKLGTTVFVAHPQGRPRHYMFGTRYAWTHWDLDRYAGVEVWSYMHDWIEKLTPHRLPLMCREPARFITGPDAEVLRQWDRVATRRRISGLGALDTHGKHLPLGLGKLFPWAAEGVLPYGQNFRAFSTYALVPPLCGDKHADGPAILTALKDAACWICHDELHSGRDIRYFARTGDTTHVCGTEMPFQPGIELVLELPCPARIRLLCRGETVTECEDSTCRFSPTAPGEYRAEASLNGKPWLLTNHMYLREN